MENLIRSQDFGFKLDELLGVDISCAGHLGNLIDGYGDLILETAAEGKDIPDELRERFWNLTVNSASKEEIKDLYKELISL